MPLKIHVPSSVSLSHRKQVLATKSDAERDGIKVPVTLDEYCVRTQVPPTDDGSNLLYDDYYDDEDLEDEDVDEDCCYDDDDSGTEDSWPCLRLMSAPSPHHLSCTTMDWTLTPPLSHVQSLFAH